MQLPKKILVSLLIAAMLTLLFSGCVKKEDTKTLEKPQIIYETPEWYRDAKFGIFIHYGVYSVPAFGDEWYGHWMYIPASSSYGNSDIYNHHIETYGGAENFGYKDFIPDFLTGLKSWKNNGMAEKWAELFKNAGAKYVVPVGIHHDSYALYASDIQKTYNSVSGAGVDYIGELKEAVTDRGMKFGVSNHFAENDWFFDENSGKNTDLTDKAYSELYGTGGEKTKEHIEKWYNISMEIIEKYQPDLIYYDFDLGNDALNRYENANRYLMLSNYYEAAKNWAGNTGVVCNNKYGAFTDAEATPDKERMALTEISPAPWQSDTSVGKKSWGYTTDEVYRSGEEFIGALVDIVSKNGNLLLNVGPKADGTIPEGCLDALNTIGAWLNTYGDAIYATRPWIIFGEGNSQNEGDNYVYSSADIRFTRSKDRTSLYITALGAPEQNKMTVKTLKKGNWNADSVDKICLIDGRGRTELLWEQTETGLVITLPEGIKGAYSVEVTFAGGGVIPAIAIAGSEITQAQNYEDAKDLTLGTDHGDGSETVYNTEENAWAKYLLNLNADDEMLLMRVSGSSEGTITVYKDDPEGEKLGEVTVNKNSEEDYQNISCKINSIAGKQQLCFVFSGKIELSNFKLYKTKNVNEKIEAESFDLKSGSLQAEPCAEGGENLGYVKNGDYAGFLNVDFGESCNTLYVRLAGSGQSCRVRLDSPNGPVIAECGNKDTGGWGSYDTFKYDFDPISGVHDVYITYDTGWSDLNINWFAFSDGSYNP